MNYVESDLHIEKRLYNNIIITLTNAKIQRASLGTLNVRMPRWGGIRVFVFQASLVGYRIKKYIYIP